jgi:glycosyltransferase involved in cell wall biosynthesis
MKTLTIIVPVYNEELVLDRFVSGLAMIISRLQEKYKCSVLFVNNGSTDTSLDLLKNLAPKFENFGILSMTRNFGYETALIAGLTHAPGDIFALCDADGEDPFELLLDFQSALLNGYEIAIGIRKNRHEARVTRAFRLVSYKILAKLSDDPFRRNAGNFSMFSLVVRNAILRENLSFPFLRSTLSRTGYRAMAFPHDRNPRIDGKSKYRKISLMKFAIAGFMTATTWPLRFVSYLAAFNAIFFVLLSFSNIIFSQVFGVYKEFFSLLLLTEIGLSLGVIALYVARIYKNSLGRPLFYVDWQNSYRHGKFEFRDYE